jgi:acyl carrier protein
MNNLDMKTLLKEIFKQILPEVEFDKIQTSRPLREQVEIDSFDYYRLIVQISERTGVIIPDSKLAEMKNLGDLVTYLSSAKNTS